MGLRGPAREGRPLSASGGSEDGRFRTVLGEADADLDQALSDELDKVNAAATRGTPPARELTVRVSDETGRLAAGMSGWTWGIAAGIGLTWVREDARAAGLGARLLEEFETEARRRGCDHVFVTSFTFQAPGFYERHGYREIFRWEDVPVPGAADVHLRKDL
ncbi:GNAT family N-acetyltransferase [Nocardioides marmotae]|uniref:GNAT family N-acetyltransferase n=1 Tax=Nocardioides marmotae TaxID=2663857 RepID=UPI001CAA0E1B|nr:GNAT family N-acetyltransferase [Nocardioides marmotae]